jgi:hypothetical protein
VRIKMVQNDPEYLFSGDRNDTPARAPKKRLSARDLEIKYPWEIADLLVEDKNSYKKRLQSERPLLTEAMERPERHQIPTIRMRSLIRVLFVCISGGIL